jgi:hypothetical protein
MVSLMPTGACPACRWCWTPSTHATIRSGEGHEVIEEAAGIFHGVHFHEDEHDVQRKRLRPGCVGAGLEADLPSHAQGAVVTGTECGR